MLPAYRCCPLALLATERALLLARAGIFSKLWLDTLIPDRWRLPQSVDSTSVTPNVWPVFLKPEWGQNAHGIFRVDDADQLHRLRADLSGSPHRYLVQQAAPGTREYEIFTIANGENAGEHDVLTITEAVNTRERFPINSKYNRNTRYCDITSSFSETDRQLIAGYLSQIGQFGISRMSVRADSNEALAAGEFHVIEINLFLPMPINLLDSSYSWRQRWRFIRRAMMSLAHATRAIRPMEEPQPIFARMVRYGCRKAIRKCFRERTQHTDHRRTYDPTVKSIKALIYGWISRKYLAGCSNYNSLQVRKASRSKRQAREMFARHGVPHARGEVFVSPLTAVRFAREHGFPLCIKPNVSGFSRGSHFPITNYRELWKAALMVKVWWPTSIVEQYLLGANYRVLATQDGLVSVIRRYPPFVDGDGEHSIGELIDIENGIRERMGLYPTIHPIEKSAATIHWLGRQGLTLDSVPDEGQRIYTFNRVALAPGGVVEIIDQSTIPTVKP